jgi:hypothetical protein
VPAKEKKQLQLVPPLSKKEKDLEKRDGCKMQALLKTNSQIQQS